uniref:Uncharacterized protein n=1 Tax=Euplotes harpa TaxID=151035 RepID=A0A7S3J3I4_9SPIT
MDWSSLYFWMSPLYLVKHVSCTLASRAGKFAALSAAFVMLYLVLNDVELPSSKLPVFGAEWSTTGNPQLLGELLVRFEENSIPPQCRLLSQPAGCAQYTVTPNPAAPTVRVPSSSALLLS